MRVILKEGSRANVWSFIQSGSWSRRRGRGRCCSSLRWGPLGALDISDSSSLPSSCKVSKVLVLAMIEVEAVLKVVIRLYASNCSLRGSRQSGFRGDRIELSKERTGSASNISFLGNVFWIRSAISPMEPLTWSFVTICEFFNWISWFSYFSGTI